MRKLTLISILVVATVNASIGFAGVCRGKEPCQPIRCEDDVCCARMGGVSYCDSSAGRLVCKNGEFSSCYCTRHAVMDLQLLQGCCLWNGGVLSQDTGVVICNDGSVSPECTLQNMYTGSGTW